MTKKIILLAALICTANIFSTDTETNNNYNDYIDPYEFEAFTRYIAARHVKYVKSREANTAREMVGWQFEVASFYSQPEQQIEATDFKTRLLNRISANSVVASLILRHLKK